MRKPTLSAMSVVAHASLLVGAGPQELEELFLEAGLRPQDPSRRQFLKTIGLGAAAVTSSIVLGEAVEKALWVPGAKTFFLPAEKGPIVSGQEAIGALNAITIPGGSNPRTLGPSVSSLAAYVVHTGAGEATFDGLWNLLAINRQPVTAREAAILQSNGYVRGMPPRHNAYELKALTREIQARRDLAGIKG